VDDKDFLAVVTENAYALVTKAKEVNELAGPGRGVRVIKVQAGDKLVGFLCTSDKKAELPLERPRAQVGADGPPAGHPRRERTPAGAEGHREAAADGAGRAVLACRGEEIMAVVRKTRYSAADIQVLEGLEPVRKRPAMYIGGVDASGYHHLLWEILDNSVDEVINGYASRIEVTLHKDGKTVTITDDGRGIPWT